MFTGSADSFAAEGVRQSRTSWSSPLGPCSESGSIPLSGFTPADAINTAAIASDEDAGSAVGDCARLEVGDFVVAGPDAPSAFRKLAGFPASPSFADASRVSG